MREQIKYLFICRNFSGSVETPPMFEHELLFQEGSSKSSYSESSQEVSSLKQEISRLNKRASTAEKGKLSVGKSFPKNKKELLKFSIKH